MSNRANYERGLTRRHFLMFSQAMHRVKPDPTAEYTEARSLSVAEAQWRRDCGTVADVLEQVRGFDRALFLSNCEGTP